MAKGDDLQERLVDLGVKLLSICDQLPKTTACAQISSQLLRSGTSPAPNYAEARGAESDRDFIHKLQIVLKELNESLVWLMMIGKGNYLPEEELAGVREECTALCRITAASIKTVRQRIGKERWNPVYNGKPRNDRGPN